MDGRDGMGGGDLTGGVNWGMNGGGDNIEVWKVRLWRCAFLIHFKGYDYFKDYSASKIF